jgi:hypothetical protein
LRLPLMHVPGTGCSRLANTPPACISSPLPYAPLHPNPWVPQAPSPFLLPSPLAVFTRVEAVSGYLLYRIAHSERVSIKGAIATTPSLINIGTRAKMVRRVFACPSDARPRCRLQL